MHTNLSKIDRGHRIGRRLAAGAALVAVCLAILISSSCLDYLKPKYTHNYNYSALLGYSDFDVAAEEVGASARGSILVSRSKANELDIKIMASFVIAPSDWGGIRFIFPRGCYVKDILCTYVDSDSPDNSFELYTRRISGLDNGGEIVVGVHPPGSMPSGGAGTIIIEFAMPVDTKSKIPEVKFDIYLGSRWEDDCDAPVIRVITVSPGSSLGSSVEEWEINIDLADTPSRGCWVMGVVYETIAV